MSLINRLAAQHANNLIATRVVQVSRNTSNKDSDEKDDTEEKYKKDNTEESAE